MFAALLIVNILLSLPFLLIGGMKLLSPAERMRQNFKVEGADAVKMRLIGLVEIVGVAGLLLPLLLDVLPILTPLAAVGLLVIMVLAVRVHRAREESYSINILLGLLASASAVLGFVVVLG